MRGRSFMSSKLEDEYDCKERLTRLIFFSFYAENMARGSAVYSDPTPDKWVPIKPNTARGKTCGNLPVVKRGRKYGSLV